MTGGVLTLDIASATGWACWEGPGRLRYGTYRLPAGGRMGRRLRAYGFWLDGMLSVTPVERLVYEAPLLRSVGENQTSIQTAQLLMGLVAVTCLVAEGRDIAIVEPANNQTVRAHFLGSARGRRDELKRRCIDMCRAYGWSPKDDNCADALAILHWTLHRNRYDHDLPATPLFGAGRAVA